MCYTRFYLFCFSYIPEIFTEITTKMLTFSMSPQKFRLYLHLNILIIYLKPPVSDFCIYSPTFRPMIGPTHLYIYISFPQSLNTYLIIIIRYFAASIVSILNLFTIPWELPLALKHVTTLSQQLRPNESSPQLERFFVHMFIYVRLVTFILA